MAFSVQPLPLKSSPSSPSPLASRKWGCVEYSTGILGLATVAAVIFVTLDYERLQKILNLSSSWERPKFSRPAPTEVPFVELTLVEGAVEKGAVCLDGSPPAYHLHRGSGSGENSWLVHLEGGGWCSSNQTCATRSTTRLGSSRHMEDKILFGGILSNSPLNNPDFYDWNRVKVRYCDGGSFSGEKEVQLPNDTSEMRQEVKQISFKGRKIWEAVLEDLLAKGMKNAERALLSGCSAGGLASILHCDDFRSRLPKKAIVKCLSDAGLFLDVKDVSGQNSMQAFYKDVISLHGIEGNLPEACKAVKDIKQCFYPQYLLSSIKTPLFVLQSAYDNWQIEHILVPAHADSSGRWKFCKENPASCSEEQLKILQGFRETLLEAIDSVEGSEDGGLLVDSCFIHCQSESDLTWNGAQAPRVNKRTIAGAVGDWFFKRRPAKDIDCAYPCNPTCFHVGVWG